MFIPCTLKKGSAYYEFQYCKKIMPVKELVTKGYGFWKEDSLLVPLDEEKEFFKNYRQYLELTHAPNGTDEFCYFGVNYYTKEQTQQIIEKIQTDHPKEFERLTAWLEKAATHENGFFFLGI